jgi:hypothetical protein
LTALFGLPHDRLVTPVGIAPEHCRFLMRRKTIEQPPQSGRRVFGRMGIPGLHLDPQNQAKLANM